MVNLQARKYGWLATDQKGRTFVLTPGNVMGFLYAAKRDGIEVTFKS